MLKLNFIVLFSHHIHALVERRNEKKNEMNGAHTNKHIRTQNASELKKHRTWHIKLNHGNVFTYYVICLRQQLVGESNPDKEKVIHEFQNRLHGPLNNKNMGSYVKAFMR